MIDSKRQLIQQAHRILAVAASAQSAPVAVWADLEESQEAFSRRLKAARLSRNGRILAVIPYGFTTPQGVEPVAFTPRLFRALHPSAPKRNRVISGGRGSGKSHGIALAIILKMLNERVRILCCREIMRSLRESVHHLLSAKIGALRLDEIFDINDRSITCIATKSEAIFAGLFANLSSLRSLEDIGLCWIEESEAVSALSLETLHPTLRSDKSEFWYSLNPQDEDAPVMELIDSHRPDVSHVHVDFRDNPWFPRELEAERAYLEKVDTDAYEHIWMGKCRRVSDSIIFNKKWICEDFEPRADWSKYCGLDFGFSADPSAAVECYVADRRLYVRREYWALRVELDNLARGVEDAIPNARNAQIKCDCSRPESISFLQRHGMPHAIAASKWPGSIEDGIAYLRSFEAIIVHPSCAKLIDELKTYAYKIDKLTGKCLTEPKDSSNHLIDALRYSLCDLIRTGNNAHALINYYKNQAAIDAATAITTTTIPHFQRAGIKWGSL